MPANLVNARQGVLGQLVKIKETDGYDVDPALPVPVILPMSDAEALANTQPLNPARIGDGRRTSKGSWLGMIDDSGDIPTSLDFNFIGHDLVCHLGEEDAAGNPIYSMVTSGGFTTHRWVGWGVPISFQIEKRHQQTTAIYHRHRGVFSTIMAFRPAAAGQAAYTTSHLGVGDFVRTASTGTTVDYAPFTAHNYFNGFLKLEGQELDRASSRSPACSIPRSRARMRTSTKAWRSAVNFGIPIVEGDLGRIFSVDSGDTFMDLAINETIASLEFLYANAPLTSNPTQWCRIILPAVRFSRREPNIRLDDSEDQTQHFMSQAAAADIPASVTGSAAGTGSTSTFTVAASTTVVVSFGGGADITVPALTTGSRTLAQIVTEINAHAPFAAEGTASAWNGHLRIEADTTTDTIQFKVGGATFNTLFGFGTTLISPIEATDLIVEVRNTKATLY